MAGIDTAFMTDQQLTWYRKLVRRDPTSWTSKQRKFMDDMKAEAHRVQDARDARWRRGYQAMIEERTEGTHPGIGNDEGWEMEFPGIEPD